jgi:L-rhamnose mutarotase
MKEYFASFQKRKIDSCSPKHEPDIAQRWWYHCDACYEPSALFPILTIFNEVFHWKVEENPFYQKKMNREEGNVCVLC